VRRGDDSNVVGEVSDGLGASVGVYGISCEDGLGRVRVNQHGSW
jgi:hypothetical protein